MLSNMASIVLAPTPATFNPGPHLKGTPRGFRGPWTSKFWAKKPTPKLNAAQQRASDPSTRQRTRRRAFDEAFRAVSSEYDLPRAARRLIARRRIA